MTRAQRTGELSKDIRALQENPDCTKEPLCKYIFSVDVYEDLIGIRSTADWAKGNADVPFMKEVKTNYAASNEADGVIINGMRRHATSLQYAIERKRAWKNVVSEVFYCTFL